MVWRRKERAVCVLAVLMAVVAVPLALKSNVLPRAWVDDVTGLAIGGHDPVAYFTDHQARQPRSGVQALWGGVSWAFRNKANKEAFMLHPHIYAPRFAGLDPVMLAENRGVTGRPSLFHIHEKRLYLFFSPENLERWKREMPVMLELAQGTAARQGLQLGLDASDKGGEQKESRHRPPASVPGKCEPARWLGKGG